MTLLRRASAAAVLALSLSASSTALADGVEPFGQLTCTPQDGVRVCPGSTQTRVKTFDGVPIDVNVALPATADSGLPLVILGHGWGGSKIGMTALKRWARLGYAALSHTSRGFGESCGSLASRQADPAGCAAGWVRLDDTRFEIRDAQHLAGLLADQGLVDSRRIGAHGGSYGGGLSLALAALRNRVMLPDGSLVPWTSPGGLSMEIAAAAPYIPWSDLVYSLAPNGRHLDYTLARPTQSGAPIGVLKQSYVAGLYGIGQLTAYYAPPGADEDADLTTWFALTNAGEPYDGNPLAGFVAELRDHHSSYSIAADRAPAPTFLASGWTDDLFPVDEALRHYNRTRALHPNAAIALMFLDFGHARGQNKAADTARFDANVEAWFDRHLMRTAGNSAPLGIETLTQTCGTPSGGPYRSAKWATLHPGEVSFTALAPTTVLSAGGDPLVSRAIDPIAGGGACAQVADQTEAGTVSHTFAAATGAGYTLMGSPTVIADVAVTGLHAQLVTRLWDVAPGGSRTLVARGVYRPDAGGRQVFQLHPNGWHFAAGHKPQLQLLGRDVPYLRASNGVFAIGVSNLELRLPVYETPDCAQVMGPKAPVLPAGATLAPDVSAIGSNACAGRVAF